MFQSIQRKRGSALIWTTAVIGMVLLPMATIAVDFGRMSAARQQMQDATDAAALAAAHGAGGNKFVARRDAISIAAKNQVMGVSAELAASDIEFGRWTSSTDTFELLRDNDARINSVRVTMRKAGESNGGPIPVLFGTTKQEVHVRAIAGFARPIRSDTMVPATSNPWLAGMPGATYASWMRTGNMRTQAEKNPDWDVRRDRADDGSGAPNESPVEVQGVPIEPGQSIYFDAIGGEMNHDRYTEGGSGQLYPPDGQSKLSWNKHPSLDPNGSLPANDGYSNDTDTDRYSNQRNTGISQSRALSMGEHGKSNIVAPYTALIGVFLSDATPVNGTASYGERGAIGDDGYDVPEGLDFSSEQSRNFQSFSPKLGQTFYIGDGQDAAGNRQNFTVPPGATRLYLGTTDGWEWNNNGGAFQTTIFRPAQVYLVK